MSIEELMADLSGRWFGSLRWLGYAKNGDSATLKWITEDGGIQVDATFSDGSLRIDAKLLSEQDLNLAIRASYQLMAYVSRIYSRVGKSQSVAYFTAFDSDAVWSWA
jgi:hypothetical protein